MVELVFQYFWPLSGINGLIYKFSLPNPHHPVYHRRVWLGRFQLSVHLLRFVPDAQNWVRCVTHFWW